METKPKSHLWGYLIILLIAIAVSLGLAFTKTVDLGQFMRALMGNLTDANNYSLSGNQPTKDIVPEAALTGTLTVIATPDRAKFDILNASTGAVAFADVTGTEPTTVPVGDYRIVFKPMAGYDTPLEISTEITLKAPAKMSAIYTPWATCTQGDWGCSEWSPCEKGTEYRRRTCSQVNSRCTGADASQPMLYEVCAECKKEKKC